MKIQVTFDLDNDDKFNYDLVNNAFDIYRSLSDIQEHVRSRLKYAELSDETIKELEDIRNLINYESINLG